MKNLLILLILLQVISSCSTQDICDDDSQSILVARFKTTNTSEITDTTMSAITIHGIREGKKDSLLYISDQVSGIELPLDPNKDFSRFIITNEIESDTLSIYHSNEVYLISYTCGYAVRFSLEELTATGDWIKDMELRESEIDAELVTDEEHLWIYF